MSKIIKIKDQILEHSSQVKKQSSKKHIKDLHDKIIMFVGKFNNLKLIINLLSKFDEIQINSINENFEKLKPIFSIILELMNNMSKNNVYQELNTKALVPLNQKLESLNKDLHSEWDKFKFSENEKFKNFYEIGEMINFSNISEFQDLKSKFFHKTQFIIKDEKVVVDILKLKDDLNKLIVKFELSEEITEFLNKVFKELL